MTSNYLNKPVYHITHIDNLRCIIDAGGLFNDKESNNKNFCSVRIGHQHIKERRLQKEVPVFSQTTLGDYVPFYFAHRSPMLFAIHKNKVDGYSDGQNPIIYLVTYINDLIKFSSDWCFTDGHAVEEITNFYTDLKDLVKVDWSVIDLWSWKNTEEDSDRKRRKQAEFLVKDFIPWSCINEIVVINDSFKNQVQEILNNYGYKLKITVQSSWYY